MMPKHDHRIELDTDDLKTIDLHGRPGRLLHLPQDQDQLINVLPAGITKTVLLVTYCTDTK